jgi:hypothetical protein
MAGIREFDAKPVEKLLARQRRRSHLNRSSQLRVRPFSIRHGTCIPPRVSIQCREPIAKSAEVILSAHERPNCNRRVRSLVAHSAS